MENNIRTDSPEKFHIYAAKGIYCGSVRATRDEIRAQFPYSVIYPIGNAVDVWALKGRKR